MNCSEDMFPKKLGLDVRITNILSNIQILHYCLPTYSNSEVYRSVWRSKHREFDVENMFNRFMGLYKKYGLKNLKITFLFINCSLSVKDFAFCDLKMESTENITPTGGGFHQYPILCARSEICFKSRKSLRANLNL